MLITFTVKTQQINDTITQNLGDTYFLFLLYIKNLSPKSRSKVKATNGFYTRSKYTTTRQLYDIHFSSNFLVYSFIA